MDLGHSAFYLAAQRGEELCRQDKTDAGIQYLLKALKIGTSDVYLLSAVYSQLGNAHFKKKLYSDAEMFHEQDLLLARTMLDQTGEVNAYANLAVVRAAQQDFTKALTYIECLMPMALKLADKGTLARVFYTQGYVLLNKAMLAAPEGFTDGQIFLHGPPTQAYPWPDAIRDDMYTAIDSFLESAKYAEEIGDKQYASICYGSLGLAYFRLNEHPTACQYYEKRLQIATSLGDEIEVTQTLKNLASARFCNVEYEQALDKYKQLEFLCGKSNNRALQCQARCSICVCYLVIGDFDSVISSGLSHLTLARELEDVQAQGRVFSFLSSAFRSKRELLKAAYCLIRCYLLNLMANNTDQLNRMLAMLRSVIQENPSVFVDDTGAVNIDGAFDPILDDMETAEDEEPLDPSSITFALRDDANPRAVSVPDLTGPMTKYVVDCVQGLRPRNLAIPKTTKTSSRSMPNVPEKIIPSGQADLIDMLERLQSRRIDEQRCEASMIDQSQFTRQADTSRKLTNTKLCDTSVKSAHKNESFFKHWRKSARFGSKPSVASSGSAGPKFSSTPAKYQKAKSQANLDLSGISDIKHVRPEETPKRLPPPRANRMTMAAPGELRGYENKENMARSVSDHNLLNDAPKWRASIEDFIDDDDCKELSFNDHNEDSIVVDQTPRADTTYDEVPDVEEDAKTKYNPEAILDLIARIQSRRMDEQRAVLMLPGLTSSESLFEKFKELRRKQMVSRDEKLVDEKLYDLIMQSQRDRIEEQRSHLGGSSIEDDVTAIVYRMQAGRIDEQRAELNSPTTKSPPEPNNATTAQN
uniref:TPR_REGION domain-containing protein n=1 Tax=Panagrellus redivivus TaxID=6233 RepID=A0A7E4V9G9_PANRE